MKKSILIIIFLLMLFPLFGCKVKDNTDKVGKRTNFFVSRDASSNYGVEQNFGDITQYVENDGITTALVDDSEIVRIKCKYDDGETVKYCYIGLNNSEKKVSKGYFLRAQVLCENDTQNYRSLINLIDDEYSDKKVKLIIKIWLEDSNFQVVNNYGENVKVYVQVSVGDFDDIDDIIGINEDKDEEIPYEILTKDKANMPEGNYAYISFSHDFKAFALLINN